MNFREFAQHRFDVLILLLLFSIEASLLVHFSHHGNDAALQNWLIQGALGPTVGALLMALTTSRSSSRRSDGNGRNGNTAAGKEVLEPPLSALRPDAPQE